MSGFSRRYLALGALLVLVIVTVVMVVFNAAFSVIVLGNIATIAFMTVVAVMVIGSEHGHGPITASESSAVAIWTARAARREEAQHKSAVAEPVPAATAQVVGESTGQAVSDLSEAEKDTRRQAALERRKARAAKSTGESES